MLMASSHRSRELPPIKALATSSVITVESLSEDSRVHIRSASPAESARLAVQALKASAARPEHTSHSELPDPSPSGIEDPSNNVSIASRRMATATQVTPESTKPWMKRTNSPKTTSPAASPQVNRYSPTQGFRPPSANSKLDDYRPGRVGSSGGPGSRTRSPRPASPSSINRVGAPKLRLPLADFHNRPRQSSPLSSPAPRLLTPHGAVGHAGTPLSQVEQPDYFGLGIAPSKDRKSGSVSPGPSLASHTSSSRRNRDRQGDAPGSPTSSSSRPRTKERRERDKKAMLAKALERANAAVLFDNALDYQGALDEYVDACKLLLNVMDRTTSDEDKRKLNAIRVTYTTRIDELRQLLQTSGTIDESARTNLAHDTEDSLQLGATATPPPPPKDDPRTRGGMSSAAPVGQARRINASRDSFLTDAIREVEGSRSSGFLGPLWERSKNPMATGFFGDASNPSREELHDAGAPSPLAPARTPSPSTPLKYDGRDHDGTTTPPDRSLGTPQSGAEAMSWLNTIEESDSDDASALIQPKRQGKIVRRPLKSDDELPSEFDAAFDAAVEAAYEDGSEPDQHSDGDFVLTSATYGMPAPISDLKQGHARTESDTQGGEMGHGFDFNLNAQSLPGSLPQSAVSRSDHSVEAEVAWPGTLASDSATATRISEPSLQQAPRHTRKKSNTLSSADYPSNISPAKLQPATIEIRPASSGANEGPVSGMAPLAIQTSLSPGRNRATSRTSQNTPPGTSAPSVEDVAPWTVRGQVGDFRTNRRNTQRDDGESASRKTSSALSEMTMSPTSAAFEGLQSPKYTAFQKHEGLFPPPEELPVLTPNSVFTSPGSRRSNEPVLQLGQRVNTASSGTTTSAMMEGGGPHLFDATLGTKDDPSASIPSAFEPCPESSLLRPFWLLRIIESATVNPRGGYLTRRLFLPREAWLNKTIKLKNVEDKVASCDTLTTSLAKLATVDSLDAEAVLEELQVFEDVMEKVQATLSKKLGNEVGISGVAALFKDAGASTESPPENGTRESMKMHSGKSYLTGWRKLRSKTLSGGGGIVSMNGVKASDAPSHSMATVPMTSGSVSDKQNVQRREALHEAAFDGPLRDYMSSIARLCDAAQSLDQIARQVEDPGLKHSSPTHVGLELSMRHAAEFFGLWICRFILTDIGVLIDKHVKRSTEWLQV